MIQGIVFDLDDTLYNQIEPFETAIKQSFPDISLNFPIKTIYRLFRLHSDQAFPKQTSGEWSLSYMRRYRIRETIKDLAEQLISAQAADNFQQNYATAQGAIKLANQWPPLLSDLVARKMTLGLITNGPDTHQVAKIEQLALNQWFPKEHLIISGQVGIEKPQPAIFALAAQKLQVSPENLLYIGDSYQNDVIGAKGAGWQVLWFNHRNEPQPTNASFVPDWEINHFNELHHFITQINPTN